MTGPNLFIIGAMKAGTTSLHRYLVAHPDVFMCEPKEPGFFVAELNWYRGEQWYLDLFRGAGGAAVVGESSTHYTKRPTYEGVADRIHKFNADARFIYLMRDPVERIVSHYWHNVRSLHDEAERHDMLTAVQRDSRYMAYGDYAMQLEPYLSVFGAERIACVTFEKLVSDPPGTVGRLCRWLGLETDVPLQAFTARWNARPGQFPRVRGRGLLNRVRRSRFWATVGPLVPKRVRRLGTSLAVEPADHRSARVDEAVAYVQPVLREQVAALSRLLRVQFPEWTRLSQSGGDRAYRSSPGGAAGRSRADGGQE